MASKVIFLFKRSVSLLIVLGLTAFVPSCKKKKDETPAPVPFTPTPTPNTNINIAQIKAKYLLDPSQNYRFQQDSFLYCTVIADEVEENFYRELYVRDASGVLKLKLKATTVYVIGDSLKVNLKGSYLNDEFDHIQLDSVSDGANLVKVGAGNNKLPVAATLAQLLATLSPGSSMQSQLVTIPSVEFVNIAYPTFADATNFITKNQTLQSCSGNTVVVRTRGFASFAGVTLPSGNGSVTAIVSQYNNELQLRIRKISDVSMSGPNCSITYQYKNFNDNSITSGGWSQYSVSGAIPWITATFGGSVFASCNNYTGGVNNPCETWLISPALNLASSVNPNLYFQNASNYTGPMLQTYVSTNYVSGDPSLATWTLLNPTLSAGAYVYVSSGAVSLSAYKTNSTRVAFKYTGSGSDGRVWQVDDIYVKEN